MVQGWEAKGLRGKRQRDEAAAAEGEEEEEEVMMSGGSGKGDVGVAAGNWEHAFNRSQGLAIRG